MDKNADRIKIHNLKVKTIIGVYAWERQVKQILTVDIDIFSEIKKIAESDQIELAIDYAKVAKATTQFIETSAFQLIETLAERTAEFLLKEFAISRLGLTVSKSGVIENAEKVSITIERP